jgi:hypothetical protein
MNRRERINRLSAKEDLIEIIKTVTGTEPPGIRHILSLLTHEDVIDAAVDFLNGSRKVDHVCEIYTEGGWSCIQEYEAKTETIWSPRHMAEQEALGGTFHEMWCDPCRQRYLSGSEDFG